MEDQKILSLLWKRAERALDAMARRYGPRLYRTARNILGIHEDAEETVNDTYLAVWNAVPPVRPDPLEGYVYRTGRNIALDRLRYQTAEKRCGKYDVSLDELEGCIPTRWLEETLDAVWLGRAINAYLGTLNQTNRSIFLRRYWYGDDVKTIAKDLELRPNTVTVRLSRMRTALHDHLEKEGFV